MPNKNILMSGCHGSGKSDIVIKLAKKLMTPVTPIDLQTMKTLPKKIRHLIKYA